MKKLMMLAAIVCAATFANAATYNWSAINDWYSPDGDNDLVGTAYIFDGSAFAQSTLVAALAGGDLGQLANAMDSAALDYGAFAFSGSGLTDNGADPAYGQMFVVVMNDDNSGYWASDVVQTKITDAIKGGSEAGFSFGENDAVAFSPINVPEPTSGFLLLLGMAGLALKRKRA